MIKKKLKLDFYTAHQTLVDLQPIQARTKPPTWWKSIKNSYDQFRSRAGVKVPTPTVKTCPGIVDYIRKPVDEVELVARTRSALNLAEYNKKLLEQKNRELVENTLFLMRNNKFNVQISKFFNPCQ